MKREEVFEEVRTPALGSDVTSVKVKGNGIPSWLRLTRQVGLG